MQYSGDINSWGCRSGKGDDEWGDNVWSEYRLDKGEEGCWNDSVRDECRSEMIREGVTIGQEGIIFG